MCEQLSECTRITMASPHTRGEEKDQNDEKLRATEWLPLSFPYLQS